MSDIVFIADFFAEEIVGGGELNNQELIQLLRQQGHNVTNIKSLNVTPDYLNQLNADTKFIVSNFIQLAEQCKKILENDKSYVIYEHDHKYIKSRNPAEYDNYTAPPEELINLSFYKNAKATLCQSSFHKSIVQRNIAEAHIVNLSGNLWSTDVLDILERLSHKNKQDCCSIMVSDNWHKNTKDAVLYCKAKDINFDLILPSVYQEFLERLSDNDKFIFFPKTPETLSRVVVESRMCGMKVVTNKNVGATYEPWFELKGIDLINHMRNKRQQIPQIVLDSYE
jgi:hypothetical protein